MRRSPLVWGSAVAGMLGVVFVALVQTQGDPTGFWQKYMQDLRSAVTTPSTSTRVEHIWLQLVQYTGGQLHPVLPAENFHAGESLPNGMVLLDLSIAGNPHPEVTAFFLAHEYGHQVLGHPQLQLTPFGRYLAAFGGTQEEDDADRWAAGFMRWAHYDITPALNFICTIPIVSGDTHSSGPDRAKKVAKAFDGSVFDCPNTTDSTDQTDSDTKSCEAQYQACLSKVPTVDECVTQEFPQACIDSCVTTFGRPFEMCRDVLCQPTPFNVAGWRSSCSDQIRDKEDQCRTQRDDCGKR